MIQSTGATAIENSTRSLTISLQTFVLYISPAFSVIPFQSYTLPSDAEVNSQRHRPQICQNIQLQTISFVQHGEC
jgi:hypothetical protein